MIEQAIHRSNQMMIGMGRLSVFGSLMDFMENHPTAPEGPKKGSALLHLPCSLAAGANPTNKLSGKTK